MNKYRIIKYAIIDLTFASHTASAASFLKPELRTFTQYAEPTKQALIQTGNAYWNYELAQQPSIQISFQETNEGVLIN